MASLSVLRLDVHAAVQEFIGTTFFLLFAFGGIQASAFSVAAAEDAASRAGEPYSISSVASVSQLLYIAASMGFSLLVSVWLFFRVSGGQFNPAVSTSLLLIGGITPFRWALCCTAQLLGGIAASGLILALVPGPLVVNTTPGPGISNVQAMFIEMFLTGALCLSVLMLGAEKHSATPFAPIGVGLTLFAGHLWGVAYTGAAMNTARAFGPAVVSQFTKSHWVYWVGPFLGSLLATGLYTVMKHIEYQNINPNQDSTLTSFSPPDPLAKFFRARRPTIVRADSSDPGKLPAQPGLDMPALESQV